MGICKTLLDEILSIVLPRRFPEIERLTELQMKAVLSYVNHQDVFAVLPTGYGKSLIFQIIPDICKELSMRGLPYVSDPIIIVICPLNSLVDSHIRQLQAKGFTAASLTSGNMIDEEGIRNGKYSFVFGSPESFLSEKWRDLLREEAYQNRLFGIVTDEVHVIPKWQVHSLITENYFILYKTQLCTLLNINCILFDLGLPSPELSE